MKINQDKPRSLHMNCCFDPDMVRTALKLIYPEIASADNDKEYYFAVDSDDDINYRKIEDSLSYANPFCVVKGHDSQNGLIAIVHHTILDKLNRSHTTEYRKNNKPHECIGTNHPLRIKPKEIQTIINDIADIKRAKWIHSTKSIKDRKIIKVTNIKVNY